MKPQAGLVFVHKFREVPEVSRTYQDIGIPADLRGQFQIMGYTSIRTPFRQIGFNVTERINGKSTGNLGHTDTTECHICPVMQRQTYAVYQGGVRVLTVGTQVQLVPWGGWVI